MTEMTQVQEAPKEKTTATKATETVKRARGMVKEIYRAALEAEAEGKPRAYVGAQNCYEEILLAMDITPIWWENYAGLSAAKRAAPRFISKSDSEGYTGGLCTYATNCVGFDALRAELGQMPPDSPDGGMARPTMMLGSGLGMVCDPRYKLFQTLQRYLGDVPVYVHNVFWPPHDANIKEVESYYIKYLVAELKGLVDFLEKQTGTKMDWDKLNEIIDIAEETRKISREIHQLRKAVPCPMPAQDNWNCMVPSTFFKGTREALDFFRDLREEVKHRVDNKIGSIPEEKYRIVWGGGLPPWHSMRLFNYFESLGAVVLAGDGGLYADCIEIPEGVTHPLERIAWRRFKEATYWPERAQKHTGEPEVEALLESIDEQKADGVVMHRVFTCRTLHVGLINRLRMLREYTDIPGLLLEGDICDPNLFPEVEAHAKIDAFIELVDTRKKRK